MSPAGACGQLAAMTQRVACRRGLPGRTSAPLHVHATDFFNWQSRLLSIAPSFSWQIFSGGRIHANIELQTATQQELLAAYDAAVLQAFQDVEVALYKVVGGGWEARGDHARDRQPRTLIVPRCDPPPSRGRCETARVGAAPDVAPEMPRWNDGLLDR